MGTRVTMTTRQWATLVHVHLRPRMGPDGAVKVIQAHQIPFQASARPPLRIHRCLGRRLMIRDSISNTPCHIRVSKRLPRLDLYQLTITLPRYHLATVLRSSRRHSYSSPFLALTLRLRVKVISNPLMHMNKGRGTMDLVKTPTRSECRSGHEIRECILRSMTMYNR
jgi:hypothetical protein